MLRGLWPILCTGSIFLGEAVADEALQPARPPGGLQARGDVPQLVLLAGTADRLAEAVGPLMAPPPLLLLAQVAARQLLHPVPLQVQGRRQRQLHPPLHRLEPPPPHPAAPCIP